MCLHHLRGAFAPVARGYPKFLGPAHDWPSLRRFRLCQVRPSREDPIRCTYCANCKIAISLSPGRGQFQHQYAGKRAVQGQKTGNKPQGLGPGPWRIAGQTCCRLIPASLQNFGMLNPVTPLRSSTSLGIDKTAPLPAFAKTFRGRPSFKNRPIGSHFRKVVFFPGRYGGCL